MTWVKAAYWAAVISMITEPVEVEPILRIWLLSNNRFHPGKRGSDEMRYLSLNFYQKRAFYRPLNNPPS
ncbi:MAG: hypothetical protein AB3N64_04275 [Puniceicoccaceae bacterium]